MQYKTSETCETRVLKDLILRSPSLVKPNTVFESHMPIKLCRFGRNGGTYRFFVSIRISEFLDATFVRAENVWCEISTPEK